MKRTWKPLVLAAAVLAVALVALLARPSTSEAVDAVVTVYKSPYCGCCTKWVDHMQENGFTVEVKEMVDVSPVRQRHGIDTHLASCHTSTVAGYALEGHVPADVVKKLLKEKPQVAGLAVPGMPQSAPGMDIGNDPYDVLAFRPDGGTYVFARE